MSALKAAIPQVNFYFDVVCPNSWIAWKVLRKWSGEGSSRRFLVNSIPVCDYKMDLHSKSLVVEKNREMVKSGCGEDQLLDVPQGTIKTRQVKEIVHHEDYELPADWEETYTTALHETAILPQIFIASVKEHQPAFVDRTIDHLGTRLWEKRLPLHKGCYLSTCAREIGIQFRDAEFIVSRLSHRLYRQLVDANCQLAVHQGATSAPFFTVADNISDDDVIANSFTDISQLMKRLQL